MTKNAPSQKRMPKIARATHAAPIAPVAPQNGPSKPALALTANVEKCLIFLEGVGDTISDISGSYTVAKRLAMAYTEITGKGVCGNIDEAFEITGSTATPPIEIHARLKPQCPVMQFSKVNPEFIAKSMRADPIPIAPSVAGRFVRTRHPSYWNGD
ncbi:MAG: hypothetical protein P4L61_00045 [Candidatus Pacebacteria bacterium]|nr:hypothetical protein [Candidatus Paceibacterota bacterium]